MDIRKNVLIVLSAGEGRRMGKGLPKMLIPVLGKPLLYWALKNLQDCSAVRSLILVVPRASLNLFEEKVKSWECKNVIAIVAGGAERIDSTRNALKALPKECRWVGVHDAARIFVSPNLVEACFKAARRRGAAILAVPCTDTIKIARSSLGESGSARRILVQETVPRVRCWSAQTPQVLRRDIVEKIYGISALGGRAQTFTDDASIAESMGFKVEIVPSSYENIKITMPSDLVLAESILKKRKRM